MKKKETTTSTQSLMNYTINISVIVDNNVEVVVPNDNLIAEDIAEIAGLVYKEQFLEML